MDISETWKKLGQEKLEKPMDGKFERGDHSRHPVTALKNNYKTKATMLVAFLVCFAGLFFWFDEWLIKGVLLVVIAAYIIFFLASLAMYKRLNKNLPVDGRLLDVLVQTKDEVSRALKFETISSLLIFPFAGAAGYMMGYRTQGLDPANIFESPYQLGVFIVVLIIFLAFGYWLGRQLMREGYGKYLDQIEEMILALRNE